jgi:arabinofuranan 3-O-arabinosyltransferase
VIPGGPRRPSPDPGLLSRTSRSWLTRGCGLLAVLVLVQAPGLVVPDTKFDLTADPGGFLARAAHLWTSQAPLGQVQNQAYGYLFPQGGFFLLGDELGLPGWVVQRSWWAVLLCLGLVGVVRLADTVGVGTPVARLVAGAAYVLAPRVLTTLGPLSSETLPVVLAPWVLLGVVRGLRDSDPRRSAVLSAVAVAGMGAVNAVATLAACAAAGLWWASHRPDARWLRFTAWWVPSVAAAVAWWVVPLLLLGRYSPPFLDVIETSATTTRWTSLVEVLRGTDDWVPFVSADWISGAVLASQPAAVLGTAVVAAAGLGGLLLRGMPARGRWVTLLLVGVVGMAAGHVGPVDGLLTEQVRAALDGALAPLRNVHKVDPLVRLPLVLGLANLVGRVPLPGSASRTEVLAALRRPERRPVVAVVGLVGVAVVLASSVAWTGRLAPAGTYGEVPGYWAQAAQWLADHAAGDGPGDRALVAPGAPFAQQVWGTTRDEPLQALASTPWAVRDAVPLVPPGAVRALDSVQRLFADGRPSAGLAATLAGQGVRYVVVRNDLDPATSRSARAVLVRAAVTGSPGMTLVAQFGPSVGAGTLDGLVSDHGLHPPLPAVQVYEVAGADAAGPSTGPRVLPLADVPVVQGGPESLLRLAERGSVTGPALLNGDADAARVAGPVLVTDAPTDREGDVGRVDDRLSAVRSLGDPRRTANAVADDPVSAERATPLVQAAWTGARPSASSSAADATQPGSVRPGDGVAAAVDRDPTTAWLSRGLLRATGQWYQLDLDVPVPTGRLTLTTSPLAAGSPVSEVRVSTAAGSATSQVVAGRPVVVALPAGTTSWVRVTALAVSDGSGGQQFGLAELTLSSGGVDLVVQHALALPAVADGRSVRGWDLGAELPGRRECVRGPTTTACTSELTVAPEEPGRFARTLQVPAATAVTPEVWVRSRPGAALDGLLDAASGSVVAAGSSSVTDPRGSARAAVDGDPSTSWSAVVGDLAPALVLSLPARRVVSGLVLTAATGQSPARVTQVSVDLGGGPEKVDVGADGVVRVPARLTDQVRVTPTAWLPVTSVAPDAATTAVPPGIAEIRVLGAEDLATTAGGRVPGDQEVMLPCASGPVLTVGGSVVQTSVTATVAQLTSGAPVPAVPCTGLQLQLSAGPVELSVDPGAALSVDGVALTAAAPAAAGPPGAAPAAVPTTSWGQTDRELQVPPAAADQLLVVPESTNPGWVATVADGRRLEPVVVDGWQQGWVVPAGVSGSVRLVFTPDRVYRASLAAGLGLLVLLGAAALVPARVGTARPATRPLSSRGLGAAGVVVVAALLGGAVGVLLLAAVAGAAALLHRRGGCPPRTAAVVAGGLAALAGAVLSSAPWTSGRGYAGDRALPQLLVLAALLVVALAALPRCSRSTRRAARRAGSSTSA